MATETTFGNSNPELWKYVTPECVLEGIRNVVANRLATSGKDWCTYFSMYNSGTYVLCTLYNYIMCIRFMVGPGKPAIPGQLF